MHLGDNEVGAINEIFVVYIVSAGKIADRVRIMGNLYKAAEAPYGITVKPVRRSTVV